MNKSIIRLLLKRFMLGVSIIITIPLILIVRISFLFKNESIFHTFGTLISIIPGYLGVSIRIAYYIGTINNMSPDVYIGFGSFFSQRYARVGRDVYIGAYCILGNVELGDEVLIASRVSITSGKNQHGSSSSGIDKKKNINHKIKIGNKSWIGEGAIVMADVGCNTIIGSGSIVTKPIPHNSVAFGNPAKPQKKKND